MDHLRKHCSTDDCNGSTAETAGEALIVRHEQPIRQTLLEMLDHRALDAGNRDRQRLARARLARCL